MADEHSLNADLARILQKAGIQAEPQVPFTYNKGKRRVADIVCYEVQGYKIGIEAKRGWGNKLKANKKSAIAQAEELVDTKNYRNFCDAAIGLIYPDSYENQDHLQSGTVKAAVRTPILIGKKKTPEWKEYAVKDLPAFIRSIPSQLGKPEELAKRSEIAVNEAFKKFSKKDAKYIMRSLGEAAEETNFKGLLIDLLTVFMFHTKLDDIIPQHFKKANSPPTVAECLEGDSIAKFTEAYKKWLKVDYKDILEWNQRILVSLPARPRSNDAVKMLAQTAQSIQRAKGAHHHDVVGIIFCNAIEAAKQEGAMYTTLPAATMLTHLLFHKTKINWENKDEVTRLRIVDFACGSGTLLIAAANYILQHEKTGEPEEVAKALLEQMLYGFDISNRAIFQTATGLGMIAPAVAFDKTQLHSMMLGVPKGETEARLGSLEMLRGMDDLIYNPPVTAKKPDSKEKEIECKQFHFAIVNPPFTMREKRHKQMNKQTEKKLREREKKIGKDLSLSSSHNTNGFIELVHKYIDPQTGKAGIVLPLSTGSTLPAKETREWLPKHFHIQYIIVSYDPERCFFSGNTTISEMLLVLERKKKIPTPTKVIKLFDNPATEVDAVQCAKDIYRGVPEEWKKWGEVDEIQPANIEKGDWSATQFLSNKLYRIALEIYNYWNSTLGKQVKIKSIEGTIRSVKDCDSRELHATPALWYHNTNHCDKMEVKPDRCISPKETGIKHRIIKSLQLTSRLKIAERVRLTTVKNFACRTTVPSVGGAWCASEAVDIINVDKETVEKAVCLILNSTPAKVSMILEKLNKIPSYVAFSKDIFNRVAMPLLSGMSVSAFRGLAKVYDEQCKQPRRRLPEAHNCHVQIEIDKAVCKHTGFPEDICKKARHLLAQEPMVTSKRYKTNPEQTNQELF